MRLHRVLAVSAAVLLLASAASSQGNKSPEARLRAAMDKETVDGDLKAAIEGYKQVISQHGASREVVAQALLRLGMVYEKQGDAEARKWYDRVVRDYGDQATAAQQARARIASAGATASGPTLRRICSGDECAGWAFGANGRWLVSNVNNRLVIRERSTGKTAQFSETSAERRICCVEFSPDGKRVAYTLQTSGSRADAQVMVGNTDGSDLRTVYRGASSETWSPDGRRLLVTASGQTTKTTWVTIADGSAKTIADAPWDNVDIFRVSPDGRYIAFSGNRDASVQENVYVTAADGSGETRVLSANPNYQEPVGWSADSRYLLYSQSGSGSDSLWAVPISNGQARGPAVLIKQFVNERVLWLNTTESGAVRYRVLLGVSDIYTASMDPTSGRVTSLPAAVPTPRSGTNVDPRWSPESRRLLYQSAGPNTAPNAPRELHLISLDDGKDQRVAEKVTLGGDGPCWSQDGRSILVNTITQPQPLREEPARVDLATGEARILFPGASTFRMRNCSNSMMPAFQGGSIRVRDIQTGAETVVYKFARNEANYGVPKISHDGRSIVFLESIDASTSAFMMVPATGGAPRALVRVTAPVQFQPLLGFAWSPDDQYVYFLRRANDNSPHELFRVPAAGGAEERMGLQGAEIRDLDIAPDGKRIAFSIGAVGRQEIWLLENFLPSGQ